MGKFQEHDTKTAETFKHTPPAPLPPRVVLCVCLFVCIGDFETGLPCDLVVEAERRKLSLEQGRAL